MDLKPAQVVAGPAVVEELDSTILLHGQNLTLDRHGIGLIEAEGADPVPAEARTAHSSAQVRDA